MFQFKGLGIKMFENLTSKLPLVAVERGSSSLKVVIAARSNGSLIVEDFLVEDLSHVPPEERTAYEKEKLAAFLKHKNIPAAVAFLVVEDEDFFSTRVTLPALTSKKELKEAISWEIKELLPFSEQEAVSDSHLIAEYQKEDGSKNAHIIYIALHKKAVEETISLLDGLNLTLESVNIVPGSLLNILNQAAGPDQKEPIAVLELGYNHTTISAFKDNKLIFTRRLSISSSDITNSMLGAFSTNNGVLKLAYEDAEKIKQEYGILSEGEIIRINESEVASGRIISMMRPVLESLIAEIRNSFDYLYEKTKESSISRIYLTGGGSRLKNIDSFLHRQLGIPVEFLSIEKTISFSPDIPPEKKEQLPYLVPAIGAMLPNADSLDFLPAEMRTKRRELVESILLRIGSVTIASVLLVSYIYMSFAEGVYSQKSGNIKINESTLQSLLQIKQEVDLMQSTVNAIKRSSIEGSAILREISIATPSQVSLESISYSGGTAGGGVQIKGSIRGTQSDTAETIAIYQKNLENSLLFENVNLASSVEAGSKDAPVLNFSINCKIEYHA